MHIVVWTYVFFIASEKLFGGLIYLTKLLRNIYVSSVIMFTKHSKLNVQCVPIGADSDHPMCPHGPTLYFYQDNDFKNGYFACSAYRDKRDCGFKIPGNKLSDKSFQNEWKMPERVQDYRAERKKILQRLNNNKRIFYCQTCNKVLMPKEAKTHSNHEKVELTENNLKDPTKLLKPEQNDKIQAQYFFDEKSLKFFSKCFAELKISKVICMGAPTLHAFIEMQQDPNLKSFLLDFDHRFYYFYDNFQFAWYNMCNNHFFDENQKCEFLNFLKCNSSNERILIFTDPPFGCRTEAITQTLRSLTFLYNKINKLPHQPLPIFWIFPYFMDQYIKQDMPELEMCDYKINYMNHNVYSDNGVKENRKLGSPVRLFTNVALSLLKLPVEEGYKYCVYCQLYTALENRHCKICGKCPSKNGSTYRHCFLCSLCVKPNYQHCTSCRRCTQIEGHNCSEYQANQRCWICQQVGHIERNCKAWQLACKKFVLTAVESENKQQIHCLICDCLGHNELKCPMRKLFIEETTFLGVTSTRLK